MYHYLNMDKKIKKDEFSNQMNKIINLNDDALKTDRIDDNNLNNQDINTSKEITKDKDPQKPNNDNDTPVKSNINEDELLSRIQSLSIKDMHIDNTKMDIKKVSEIELLQRYNYLKMNFKHIGMLYDMDPGVDNLTRKFRRIVKTII